MQEITLARDVILICGNQSLPLSEIEDHIGCTNNRYLFNDLEALDSGLEDLNYTRIESLLDLRTRRRKHGAQPKLEPLELVLEGFGKLNCTVVHDKMYALWGLAPFYRDEFARGFIRSNVIDYEQSLWVLLQRTLEYCDSSNPLNRANGLRKQLGLQLGNFLGQKSLSDTKLTLILKQEQEVTVHFPEGAPPDPPRNVPAGIHEGGLSIYPADHIQYYFASQKVGFEHLEGLNVVPFVMFRARFCVKTQSILQTATTRHSHVPRISLVWLSIGETGLCDSEFSGRSEK